MGSGGHSSGIQSASLSKARGSGRGADCKPVTDASGDPKSHELCHKPTGHPSPRKSQPVSVPSRGPGGPRGLKATHLGVQRTLCKGLTAHGDPRGGVLVKTTEHATDEAVINRTSPSTLRLCDPYTGLHVRGQGSQAPQAAPRRLSGKWRGLQTAVPGAQGSEGTGHREAGLRKGRQLSLRPRGICHGRCELLKSGCNWLLPVSLLPHSAEGETEARSKSPRRVQQDANNPSLPRGGHCG